MDNKQTIYVYRYMWLVKGSENLNIKVISGVTEEHSMFIESLKSSPDVVNACRVYMHEIDVNLIEMYDSIVDKKDESEVKE